MASKVMKEAVSAVEDGAPTTPVAAHPTPATDATPAPDDPRIAFQGLVAQQFMGALTSNLILLGDKLGLYAALKQHGPCTSQDLAKALDLSERYVREWLYQQAAAKVISCDPDAKSFWLMPAQQDVLVHEHGGEASPFFFIGGFEALPGLCKVAAERLPVCFKTGKGLEYDAFDDGVTCGVCRELGVWARHSLVDCLSRIPDIKEKLDQGCDVADVGCGCGEALMVIAKAWPKSKFCGYDISERALRVARENVAAAGLPNLSFRNPGLEEERLPSTPTFDLVLTHDAIHDMSHPHKVIPNVLKSMKLDAAWIIGDISSLDTQAATVHNHPLAPMLYGFSCHLCLPSGLSAPGALGLGTTGLPKEAMEKLLMESGFKSVDTLDWGHPLNTYYMARP